LLIYFLIQSLQKPKPAITLVWEHNAPQVSQYQTFGFVFWRLLMPSFVGLKNLDLNASIEIGLNLEDPLGLLQYLKKSLSYWCLSASSSVLVI